MQNRFFFPSVKKRIILCLTLWVSMVWVLPSWGNSPIQKQTLDNGLTIILKENHSSPLVSFQMWIKVGSADEQDKEAGVTHLIEHMLFKGTAKRKVGEIAREVETAGGDINAFTSYDETVFYLVIPSRYFSSGLDIMADAIQHSSFDPEELKREKEVVLEEVRMRTDQPSTKLDEALFSAAYTVHPYQRPIIGSEKTVQSFDRAKVMEYFRKWYTPDNMALVVTGDFKSDEALAVIKKSFLNFTSHIKATPNRPAEPPQGEMRSVILQEDVQKTYLEMAFHIPAVSHKDLYPLDLLASILGDGESSRLYQKVKSEAGLVNSIDASSYTPRDPGVMMIGGLLEADKAKPALTKIFQELYRIQDEPPSSEEIQKAKLKLTSDFLYSQQTIQGEGRQLGFFETVVGDVAFEQTYVERINQVTAQDIIKVAQKYLTPQNATIGLLVPKKETSPITYEEIKDSIAQLEKPAALSSATASPATQRFILPNGITLIVRENRNLPIVSMQAVFLGGVRFEKKENNGINNFIAEMLTKGTKKRSALDIAKEIESMAGGVSGFSGRNSFGVSCTILSQFFGQGLELFSDVLINPTFPEEELAKKRADIIAAIDQEKDQTFSFIRKNFDASFFENHPYGMDALGTKDVVGKLTSQKLEKYYGSLARSKNLVITIVGDVKADKAKKMVEAFFHGFSDLPCAYPTVSQEPQSVVIRQKEIKQGKKAQAQVMLGFSGVDIKNPDKYSLDVLNTILAGQGGRLFTELRDKQSLAYVVTSFAWEGIDPGYIAFYIGCEPSKVEKGVEEIKKEIQKISQEKVNPKELERAQNYLVGNFSIEHQTNASIAADMAFNERYGLGYDYSEKYLDKILKVSGEDVQRAAKKYLDLTKYILLIVKPEETSVIP
ncbi:MAG TPA: pitrilysin family protein [Thermodesulfobacteriota bacterium]|nr:pitrilysin family protein [Thermodesulfobacteriota bacterium]